MYVCGMTIYDLCHVGHARFLIAFDVIFRWLRTSGYRVNYVRNITDIDDKIIKRALERGMPIRQLTAEMTAAMHEDTDALGIARPTFEPRATEHVPQMLEMISTLERKGLAYRSADGDVNFAVRKFPGYGKLSGKSVDQLRAGERVAVQAGKDDPLDFVLWKAAKDSEPDDAKWDSAFGKGRPGWHIECSAMCRASLGAHFDIHGGGMDLQFPHHENEIAQSEGATPGPFVNYWLHNGFLNVNDEKMSKSLGNFFTIREVLARYEPEVVRLFLVSTHYRSQIDFADSLLEEAKTAQARLRNAFDLIRQAPEGERAPLSDPVRQAVEATVLRFTAGMDEDFNTREASASLFDLAAFSNALVHKGRVSPADKEALLKAFRELGGILGLLQEKGEDVEVVGGLVELLQEMRQEARARKDYATSDKIRDRLKEIGVVIEDGGQGFRWRVQR